MNLNQTLLTKNVLEIISEKSLAVKLRSKKRLKVKFGADPTKPDLHLGHAVGLRKLNDFLKAGHQVIFLIGDFTAKIGDPSGRNTMRPALTDKEIKANVSTWLKQVGKIIDIDKCEIRYNSEWFSDMSLGETLAIISQVSLSNVVEREDFQKRIKGGKHIAVSEILYPIMQGYDSVMLKADLEIGGQDQKLNMLMGRDLQGAYNQEKQDVITLPLLSGTDGRKMSKSYGNYIALSDKAKDAFGKLMSINDDLIGEYLSLAADFTDEQVKQMLSRIKAGENPKKIKEQMAVRVVQMYWGEDQAISARNHFDKVFSKKEIPDELETVAVGSSQISVIDALVKSGLSPSRSDARRLVKQSAIRIDGKVLEDEFASLDLSKPIVIQSGKRKFVKLSK